MLSSTLAKTDEDSTAIIDAPVAHEAVAQLALGLVHRLILAEQALPGNKTKRKHERSLQCYRG